MPEDVIKFQDDYYILATAARSGDSTRILKADDTFMVFDRLGDVQALGLGEQGLYFEDTRYLSRLVLRFGPDRPMLLSSGVRADNDLFGADLTNADVTREGALVLPRNTVHVFRCRFLWKESCHDRLRIWNYGRVPIELPIWIAFDADFADIFEIRGASRERRGRRLEPVVGSADVELAYEGLDHDVRCACLTFSPEPDSIDAVSARYAIRLEPQASKTLELSVHCARRGTRRGLPLEAAAKERALAARSAPCGVTTSNEGFNAWLDRSWSDLRMMVTKTPQGQYPYAGVPWFSTPFGRDGLITAREMLCIEPGLARGVLAYLAATQADRVDESSDAEPGKILHETRKGEMAALGEVPFGCYYGSADATPLFVGLAGAYYERTGDRDFAVSIWPAVKKALGWIDRFGDIDGDGFVEYAQRSRIGLVHQGWKDSPDAVFHADGELAEPPIALCEVQAYVFDAKQRAAVLAAVVGDDARADALRAEADAIQTRFESDFWIDDLQTYALALDGAKRPCAVRTSNAGHALFAGISSPARAARVLHGLLEQSGYSGWGIRTLDTHEPRYNPMAYHNGSIWPHDNAIIAAGCARYGLKAEALEILTGLFDASQFFDLHRLPELFCGFHRRHQEGPTLYPVACAPQAWAAGAAFMLLESCLGLTIDAVSRQVIVRQPRLPDSLREVRVQGVPLSEQTIDLLFERSDDGRVGVKLMREVAGVELVVGE
ncbi:MAG TPA: glycogen debranching N-terminal domain-containing protein [Vicinamibacterales bacterium]|jgi:glycogen debranching enzyme|nr:glycogen debranching N-terminal domain-containing protein [Vicinamibacterales bacterium]